MSKSRLAVPISLFRREHQLQYARSMRRKPTASEGALWAVLRSREHMGFRVKRQVVLGPYVADFVVPSVRLVVEVDGSAHDGREGADAMRTRNLEFLGYTVMRVSAAEVLRSPVAGALAVAAEVVRLRRLAG